MSRDADMLRVASLECSTARGSIKEAIANVPDGSPNETEVLNELRIALRAVNEAERLTEHALRIFVREARMTRCHCMGSSHGGGCPLLDAFDSAAEERECQRIEAALRAESDRDRKPQSVVAPRGEA